VCGVGGVQTPLTIAGSEQRTARMKARQKEIQSSQPSTVSVGTRRVPPVRSPGERERFAVAYHPYGPVGEAMHLDMPALGFLYAELMANTGAPPTVDLRPCLQARPVTPEEAATVDFPVLIVGGTEDSLYAPAEFEIAAGLFPKGRVNLFKGAGHAAYFERPRRFNDLVLDFLRDGHID
jgi:pimeloyl-ACP methyl ester carboxylesterase